MHSKDTVDALAYHAHTSNDKIRNTIQLYIKVAYTNGNFLQVFISKTSIRDFLNIQSKQLQN